MYSHCRTYVYATYIAGSALSWMDDLGIRVTVVGDRRKMVFRLVVTVERMSDGARRWNKVVRLL